MVRPSNDRETAFGYLHGFSFREDWGRWTDGPSATIEIGHGEAKGLLLVEIFVAGAFRTAHDPCDVAFKMTMSNSLKVALASTLIATVFAIVIAWPWGLEAMVSAGLSACFAGLAVALPDSRKAGGEIALATASTAVAGPAKQSGEAAATAASATRTAANDADEAALANLAGHLSEKPLGDAVFVFHDSALRTAIRERLDAEQTGSRIALPSPEQRLAQDLFASERLYDQAYWRNQPCVHTLIIGDGPLAMACLEEAVFAGIAGHLAIPRITLLTSDPERISSCLTFHMPEYSSSVIVNVPDAVGDRPTSFEREVVAADAASPLTAIIVCDDDESLRIRYMLWLRTIVCRSRRALAPIILLSCARSPAAELFCPRIPAGNMARMFAVRDGCRLSDIGPEEQTAMLMHEAYRAAFGGDRDSDVSWDRLPETYRIANRCAARHLAQKLWTAGLTFASGSPDPGAVSPEAFEAVVQAAAANAGEDALLRRLARLEHDRWCADRRLQGWTPALKRDNARRHHPNLVPFDDPRLTDSDIAKDVEQIRFLFRTATRPVEGGVAPPIVIGVLLGSRALSGVAALDALDLMTSEPWRPVILLCALLSDGDCDIVRDLVSQLRKQARAFRLFVPELTDDNAHLRALSTAGNDTLKGLSSLSETAFVPIHQGAIAMGDDWIDATVQSSSLVILEAYLRERAGIIVTLSMADQQQPAA